MIIKNNTAKKGPKVIFVGPYRLMPDEERDIPDDILYEYETDVNGRATGRKKLLASLRSQVRLGLITVQEKPAKAKPAKVEAPVAESVVEELVAEKPPVEAAKATVEVEPDPVKATEPTEEELAEKKAAAAARRAARRAAKEAAKNAAAK